MSSERVYFTSLDDMLKYKDKVIYYLKNARLTSFKYDADPDLNKNDFSKLRFKKGNLLKKFSKGVFSLNEFYPVFGQFHFTEVSGSVFVDLDYKTDFNDELMLVLKLLTEDVKGVCSKCGCSCMANKSEKDGVIL